MLANNGITALAFLKLPVKFEPLRDSEDSISWEDMGIPKPKGEPEREPELGYCFVRRDAIIEFTPVEDKKTKERATKIYVYPDRSYWVYVPFNRFIEMMSITGQVIIREVNDGLPSKEDKQE